MRQLNLTLTNLELNGVACKARIVLDKTNSESLKQISNELAFQSVIYSSLLAFFRDKKVQDSFLDEIEYSLFLEITGLITCISQVNSSDSVNFSMKEIAELLIKHNAQNIESQDIFEIPNVYLESSVIQNLIKNSGENWFNEEVFNTEVWNHVVESGEDQIHLTDSGPLTIFGRTNFKNVFTKYCNKFPKGLSLNFEAVELNLNFTNQNLWNRNTNQMIKY